MVTKIQSPVRLNSSLVDYGWSSSPVLKQDYQDHLEGKKSIGIQPCDDDGMASFGAIDIDPDYKKF